jgi:hypothetical protein
MHACLTAVISLHQTQCRHNGAGVQEGTPTRSELLLFKMPCSRIDRIDRIAALCLVQAYDWAAAACCSCVREFIAKFAQTASLRQARVAWLSVLRTQA